VVITIKCWIFIALKCKSYNIFPKHIDAFCAILALCSYKEVQMAVGGRLWTQMPYFHTVQFLNSCQVRTHASVCFGTVLNNRDIALQQMSCI